MRAKQLSLSVTALAGASLLLAGAQPWVSFTLEGGALEQSSGHSLNPALSPIALAIVAAALALSIAGPIFRRVLGVLVAGLGVGATAIAWTVIADPAAATAARVTELTGLAGQAGRAAVTGESLTAWPWVAVGGAVVSVLLGLVILVTSGRWAAGGRKYDQSSSKSSALPNDRISDWDSLSDGDDPTEGADLAGDDELVDDIDPAPGEDSAPRSTAP